MRPTHLICLLGLLFFALPVGAQEVVPVGKGSYLGSANGAKVENEKLYLVKQDDRPIPSNHWWTQLVVAPLGKSNSKQLWSYPLRVDPNIAGLDINFPIKWSPSGNDPACELPLTVGGQGFKPNSSAAKDWSDWLVSFRYAESAEKYMDVTLGEGMPYVWIECHGVQPQLSFPPKTTPTEFGVSSNGNCVGLAFGGRQYGVFAPDGTKYVVDGGKINVNFAGESQFLVICPLPAQKDLEYFHKYAYAIPRDTKLTWNYDPVKALVTTTWTITTDQLQGSEKQIIQGWIPHHYRNTVNDLKFNGLQYLSPRGPMKCTTGNVFNISFPYSGILPQLPAPKPTGGANDYQPDRMHQYLQEVAAKPDYAKDTYWGGKDILRFGQCALIAQQTKDDTYDKLLGELRTSMTDWFTYTPGEKDHYFLWYPKWHALVGQETSYGSDGFNDHHFHYGYFTFASALLMMHDRQWANDYGEFATMVCKEYANWDRDDKRFPTFRTFDIWQGHSWAGGTSSPGGENQESSSEEMQSWAGMIYLGQALGNNEMRDAGIMGYATASQAVMEYWFNKGGDVFPPEWKHPVTGMVWSGGKVYGKYFQGDNAWIYGIQWLPTSPMLSYLVRDPVFAKKNYDNMIADDEALGEPATIKSFGSGLGNVMLGYVLMYDPEFSCQQLDELWDEPGDKIAHDAHEMTVIYYPAHSMRNLGLVDWTSHGTSATSTVYFNKTTNARTYVVWNPLAKPETVNFYNGEKIVGHLVAGPQALTSATTLLPGGN